MTESRFQSASDIWKRQSIRSQSMPVESRHTTINNNNNNSQTSDYNNSSGSGNSKSTRMPLTSKNDNHQYHNGHNSNSKGKGSSSGMNISQSGGALVDSFVTYSTVHRMRHQLQRLIRINCISEPVQMISMTLDTFRDPYQPHSPMRTGNVAIEVTAITAIVTQMVAFMKKIRYSVDMLLNRLNHILDLWICFLWKLHKDTPNDKGQLIVYPWSGKNDYSIMTETDYLAMGADNGKFGIWLDSNFDNGSSMPCATFDNPTLSTHESFTCAHLEIWALQ
ncbi:TLD-domain-containing protein [Syncephalis plumigaleata]|nr:TLD-domain-containing protein [Syncephalis plumigaleata]